jgi:hypothetical protein
MGNLGLSTATGRAFARTNSPFIPRILSKSFDEAANPACRRSALTRFFAVLN